MKDGLRISWTFGGNLAVDDIAEDQPMLEVKFFEWARFSPAQKLNLLRSIVDAAEGKAEQPAEAPALAAPPDWDADDLRAWRRDFETWVDAKNVPPSVRKLLIPWQSPDRTAEEGPLDE